MQHRIDLLSAVASQIVPPVARLSCYTIQLRKRAVGDQDGIGTGLLTGYRSTATGSFPKLVHPIVPTPAEPNWYHCTRWQQVVVVIHVTLAV